jgi:hypothetical protein
MSSLNICFRMFAFDIMMHDSGKRGKNNILKGFILLLMSSPPTSPDNTPQDAAESVASLKRSCATISFNEPSTSTDEITGALRPGKAPMEHSDEGSSEECEDDLHPDLAFYFGEYPHLGYEQQIKICRSYASFLTAQLPPKPRRKRAKK